MSGQLRAFACSLHAAGEDARIRLWRLPPGGLSKSLLEPEAVLQGRAGCPGHGGGDVVLPWLGVVCWLPKAGQKQSPPPDPRPSPPSLPGHTEKVYSLKFHPLAANILASSSYDLTVRVWDVCAGRQALLLRGHGDQVGRPGWPLHSHAGLLEKEVLLCPRRGPGAGGAAVLLEAPLLAVWRRSLEAWAPCLKPC